MRKLCVGLLALAAIVAVHSSAVRADSTVIEGVTITGADVKQLLTALHKALQPNDMTIPIVVELKHSSEMPAYAQQWYYDGMHEQKPGVQAMYVWISSDLKDADTQAAIASAFMLAISDGGFGGPDLKKLYDIYAAKDSQLPPGAPNPYVNRQKLAAALANILMSSQ